MSEYRMNDQFCGDVISQGSSLFDDRCDEFSIAEFEDSNEAEYAAHAIRNHDALTEHNRLLQLENDQLAKDKAELVEALQGMLAVVGESMGVIGYHLNGDIADWDEFEEVANLYAAMEKHKCD